MSGNINEKIRLADVGPNDSIRIWRILSCVGVLVVHLGWKMRLEGNVRAFTDFGQYGVYLFFIISGYLACFSRNYAKETYWDIGTKERSACFPCTIS